MDHLKRVGDHIVLLGECAERRKDCIIDVFQEENAVKWVDCLSVRRYLCGLISLRLLLNLLSFSDQIVIFTSIISCDIITNLIHDV